MKRHIYTLAMAICFLIPGLALAQTNLTYISANSPADGNDAIVSAELEAMGYTVTVVGSGDYTITTHTDTNADVIVFGEALSSSAVVPFADSGFPVPCVSLEGYCPRSNRWNLLASDDDFGQIREDGANGITPVIPDHYSNTVVSDHVIFSAAGLGNGEDFAWSEEGTLPPEVVWFDLPQAAATAHAQIATEDGLNTFWTVEPDADDATNPLQHRLVIWGVHDNGLGAATDDFYAVLGNSVEWVLGNLSSTVETDVLEGTLINSPNPFTVSTTISFELKEAADMELRVYDVFGKLVSVEQASFTAGSQEMIYENANLTPGMYVYTLFADGLFAGSGKMIRQ
ncbi:MAG: T9SS type A sorting domain-containing protein [Bacteroidetes bacterium]|nr:T9SS type A sorting domain-containing protein [Bacteroidota bacterium]